MRHQQTCAMAMVGLVASAGLADPTDVTAEFGPHTPASNAAWLTYIGGVVGPSNLAPSLTDSPLRVQQSLNSMLFFMVAGPSNTPGQSGFAFNADIGGFGDGPGTGGRNELAPYAGPALTESLQTSNQPVVVTKRVDPTAETVPGGFEVVVPLPSAGVLAASGLAFVAFRRRRR